MSNSIFSPFNIDLAYVHSFSFFSPSLSSSYIYAAILRQTVVSELECTASSSSFLLSTNTIGYNICIYSSIHKRAHLFLHVVVYIV